MNSIEPTCLLIADISGYTKYLAGVELDHAQDILADLMGTVVSSLRPSFRLAKLEGDAAFMFAPASRLDGTLVLDLIEHCYFGFRRRRRNVRQATSCECAACTHIPDLDLKFVAHVGPVAHQKMAGLDELVGAPVIVVHRLLKNSVVESSGIEAYGLITQAVVETFGLIPLELGMRRHVESFDHIGEVVSWVENLEARWKEEDARDRVLVKPDEALMTSEVATVASPQLAWEFVTKPGRRVAWNPVVTDVVQIAKSGRRKVGEMNHCMHGKEAVVEQILDWRPYDYFTVQSTVPTRGGPVSVPITQEFVPTAHGTKVRTLFGKPATKRELELLGELGPVYQAQMAAGAKVMQEQIAVECDRLAADRADEPETPQPKGFVPLPAAE